MATITIDNLAALDRLQTRYKRIAQPDATPLMLTWERFIEEDNRKGVLAGTDRHGNPLRPVTYRPVPSTKPIRTTQGQRNGAARSGLFAGFGPAMAGLHNNLTSAEYRRLDGPPLAPRRQYSRVITNLKTDFRGQPGDTRWFAFGYWDQIVSIRGKLFLHYHLAGTTRLPQRDIAGVRPQGVEKARRAARAWMIDVVRSSGV